MSGLIYPTFSRKKHLRKRFEIPLDWMVDIAIDIHPREMQAVLFIATDPRNERYLFHEMWDYGSPEKIGEQIVRFIKAKALRVNEIIIDPLAKGDANNPNTMFDRIDAILHSHEYPLEIAVKDRELGILEVKNHLVGPNNEPSIFFFDDLKRTIFEIEGYMYDEDTQKPLDKDDHMMENLYRLLLLNTKYVESEEEDDHDRSSAQSTASNWTGY